MTTGRVVSFLLTSRASDGIVTLLSIVVTVLVIFMIGVVIMLAIGSKKQKKRGHTGLLADVAGERYGTVPPEFQDGQPHFGTTSLLKPFHSEYPEDMHEGSEKTMLLGITNPHGLVIMRMRTEEEFLIDKDEFLMGKERVRVDYCITSNPAVSRTHAKMIRRGNKLYIVDLNATNGTYVNGERIPAGKEVPLEVGDRFRLADEEFQIR